MTGANTEERTEFERWNSALGDLLTHITSPNLPGRMRDAINQIVPFQTMMIFGYRPRGRPVDLYNVNDAEQRKRTVVKYLGGRYLLDPFYHVYQNGVEDCFYCLKDIVPDNFKKSEYYVTFYEQSGIFDEVVLYVLLDNDLTAAMSLVRDYDQPNFSDDEVKTLNAMIPVIRTLIRHYWIGNDYPEEVTDDMRGNTSLQGHIQNAFRHFGRKLLTNRESEVIGQILRGCSTNAIAENLDITPGTVKIHRKNAYQKLSISSQNELFSMFLSSLSDPDLMAEPSGGDTAEQGVDV